MSIRQKIRQTRALNRAKAGCYVLKTLRIFRATDDVEAREIALAALADDSVIAGSEVKAVLRIHGRPERGNLIGETPEVGADPVPISVGKTVAPRCSVVGRIDPERLATLKSGSESGG